MVAAEVADSVAASMLDQGRSILLATPSELIALARRQKRALALVTRQKPQSPRGNGSAVPAPHLSRMDTPHLVH
jgi:hypothetical protein